MIVVANTIWRIWQTMKRAVMWAFSHRWWQIALLTLGILYVLLSILLSIVRL